MKIIVLSNAPELSGGAKPELIAGADSAILRHGEPVFLDGNTSSALYAPAFRIGKLGTHIPGKVASRYIDAYTIFHMLVPSGHNFMADTIWPLCDRAFPPGAWLKGDIPEKIGIDISCNMLHSDELAYENTYDFENISGHAVDAVAGLSKYFTFKTGDIIIDAGNPLKTTPVINTRTVVNIGSANVLDFKYK